MTRHTFTVEGQGRFPIDMLRYDSCYPASESESCKLSESVENGGLAVRRVELACRNDRERWTPMAARWESFGWTVLCCEHY